MKIAGIDIPLEGPLDSTFASAASKATYVASAGYSVGWLLSNQAGIAFGMFGVFAGLGINFYFSQKRKEREAHEGAMRNAREAAESALRMEDLRNEIARQVLAAAALAQEKVLADAKLEADSKLAQATLASSKVLADAALALDKRNAS